jgi:hypothetical protein
MISPYSIFEVNKNFSNGQFGFHALEIRVLFGRNSTFEHPAYLNSELLKFSRKNV